jgi:alpha-tubulin suppressor-like RCC1 family protein
MAVTGTITTRFIDENGVDLGKQLIEKDYLIGLYPNLFPQYKTSGLYLWGGNSSGQLGDNTVANKSSPVQTVTYGYTWEQVAYGSSHTVGLKNDGTLWTWGSNAYGQLGDGTFSAKSSPVQVVGYATTWQQVSSGYQHSAGVKADGTLWTWGLNNFGQLGDNSVGNEAIPVPAEIGDPFFNYNALVLTGDGTNNGTNNTFLDSSGNNLPLTRNGNVTQGTFTPYSMPDGYWSNYFDGTGDYLSATTTSALNFGTSDFTVECWINLNTTSSSQAILIGSATNAFFFRYGTGFNVAGGLNIARTGIADCEYCSFTFKVGVWYHIAVVRQSNVIKFFINGTQQTTQGSGAASYNYANETTTYIGRSDGAGELFNGYISNIRVVKSSLYTANFTSPYSPIQAIPNTSILTCQSNRFIDKSLNNFSITANGDIVVSTISPFINYTTYNTLVHGGSGWFDGSGDYITIPTNPVTALVSNNFTMECWLYFTNPTAVAVQCIYSNYTTWAANSFFWGKHSGNSGFVTVYINNFNASVALLAESSLPPGNQWVHYAVVRNGSTFTLYRNGISTATGTYTGAVTIATNPVYIGAPGDTPGSQNFPGYMSDFRIVNGTAVYTANFTPPTAPLQRVANTALLLNFTNGQIVDSIRKNILETFGDAKVSTSVVKYGSGSMYFDGTGDYLSSRLNDTYAFSTGDFTIEMWVNPSTTNHQSACLITQEHISAQNSPISISIFLNNGSSFEGVGNQLGFGQYNGTLGSTWTIQQFNIATISVGVWTHIALVRYGNNFTMFVNGVALRTVSSSVSCSIGNTQYLIARRWDISGSYPYFNGYIDDLRVTKGVARYTGNFTPPRSLLLPVAGTALLTCQNSGFVDNSFNNATLTSAGDVAVRPWSPFAATSAYDATTMGGSGYFDGTGDRISISHNSNLDLSSTAFTVEFWIYPLSQSTNNIILGKMSGFTANPTAGWSIWMNSGAIAFGINGGYNSLQAPSAIKNKTWTHVAVTSNGSNSTILYINGRSVVSTTSIINTATSVNFVCGGNIVGTTWNGELPFNGYLSSIRIVKGTVLYTSNFTPPTGPLTAITNTQLLLNFTNAGIFDLTGKNDIETVGDAKISTSIKKYGSGSVAFDGTGDYLSAPVGSVFQFGTGDFTVECWIYPTTLNSSTDYHIADFRDSNDTGSFRTGINGTTIPFVANSAGGILNGSYTFTTNTWYHFAVTRRSGTLTIWINGTSAGSNTTTTNFTGSKITIGSAVNNAGPYFGYIDDLRITTGYARYTSNFTPPTAAFGVDTYFNLTSLLISGDGVNNAQNNTFIDSSTNNFTITRSGNTTQGSFTPFSLLSGTWSNYFDGNGDTLTVAGSSTLDLTEDFTIEFWTFVLGDNSYLCNGTQSGSGCWRLYLNGSNGQAIFDMAIGSWAGLNLTSATGMFTKNVWYHFAVTRSGSSFRLFINGVSAAFALNSGSLINTGRVTQIGYYSEGSGTYYSNWYLSNLRILKGIALYTANFTPTQNFTGTGSTTWRNVSCGKYFTAATKTDGTVWTWGYNTNGQLGDYSVIHRSSAVQVLSTGNTWQQVSTGYHTAGIKTDGTMWMWGKNNLGQLGDNTVVHKSYPSQMTSGDPYYNRTVLLLNANGTNNGQNNTFIDSSNNNFTITRNGNATQGSFTPNSVPEGYWSNFFSTANSHLSCGTNSNLALGAGDFTVEFWIFCYSYNANYQCLMEWRTNGGIPANVPAIFMTPAGLPYIAIANAAGSAFVDIISNTALPLHTWNHLAYVRSGINITIYMNGVVVASAVNSTNLAMQTLAINDPQPSQDYLTTGYFSNVRIVKGFAVYTQSFTPSTVPLTAIPGTVLLTCQGNRFRDISSIGNTITPTNTPVVAPFSPFIEPTEYTTTLNGGSAYFDGTGDYLLSPTNDAVAPGSGDFTIECWIYAFAASDLSIYDGRLVNLNTSGFTINLNSSTVIRTFSNGALITGTTGNVLYRWCHVALCRSSGTTRLFLDGTLAGSAADATNYTDNRAIIGAGMYGGSLGGGAFNGYISGFRIIKGVALYTSGFIPSTTPPSLLPNTNLLLNFTNAQIFDAVGMNDLETVGDAKVSTSIVKYGTGSIAFDGNGDRLVIASNPNLLLGPSDFTVELWLYKNTNTAYMTACGNFLTGGTNSWQILGDATGNKIAWYSNSAFQLTSTTSLAISVWNHVAFVRTGTSFKLYLNGIEEASTTNSVNFNVANNLLIGHTPENISGRDWNGYIDDLRISRYPRYTSNFTPGPITTLAVPATNWKFVSCGNYFTAATKTDGTLWTWGGNTLGQLGDTTTTHRSSPVQTISSNNTWRQVSCGLNHMSALKTDGTIWSWGGNSYGNLGDNTTTHRSSPVQQIIGGITWKQISAGDRGTAAILDANY